jgi:uncharacterized protein YdaT
MIEFILFLVVIYFLIKLKQEPSWSLDYRLVLEDYKKIKTLDIVNRKPKETELDPKTGQKTDPEIQRLDDDEVADFKIVISSDASIKKIYNTIKKELKSKPQSATDGKNNKTESNKNKELLGIQTKLEEIQKQFAELQKKRYLISKLGKGEWSKIPYNEQKEIHFLVHDINTNIKSIKPVNIDNSSVLGNITIVIIVWLFVRIFIWPWF